MKHSVILPFYQRLDQVQRCVNALILQLQTDSEILLINDGTELNAVNDALAGILEHPQVHIIHHRTNLGVATARNSAIQWSRQHDVEIIIMIDSDCLPGDDFISGHLKLHQQYPLAACFGAGVTGNGVSLWAKLDKIMSWVHSVPHGEIREVKHPYHLPTTNFSIKSAMLPNVDEVFDPRLRTGEDALLIRQLRKESKLVLFSPEPHIDHFDRERFIDVLHHHYYWGHHQYFVQLNRDLSPRSFNPLFRGCFLLAFLPCLPLFALLGSILNIKPWLRYKPAYLLFYPLILLVWLGKGVAVAEAAWRPNHCLRHPPGSVTLPSTR